jgi:gamma-glutamyl-gamma-aminobutyrate hydrolase PuuD
MTAEDAPAILDAVQGLVLTGGGDIDPVLFGAARHPATGPANELRDECELALAREAAARKLPTLAICRGVQVLNVALGGTLVQDIPSAIRTTIEHDAETERSSRVHDVAIDRQSRLAGIFGADRITTNSFHHQSVERLASGLHTVATAPDDVIEAVECTDRGGADEDSRRLGSEALRGFCRRRARGQLSRRQRASSRTWRINRSGVLTFGNSSESLNPFSVVRSNPKRSAAVA